MSAICEVSNFVQHLTRIYQLAFKPFQVTSNPTPNTYRVARGAGKPAKKCETRYAMEDHLETHIRNDSVLLKELYKKFVTDMEDSSESSYIPQKRRFFNQIHALVALDPEWQTSRRRDGEVVYPARLV